jgi:hypothetical protein
MKGGKAMRRALVMVWLVSLTLQVQTLPPFGEGRAMADFMAQDALVYVKVTLTATTARLQRLIGHMHEHALERAYREMERRRRGEVMQYLNYCPLPVDDRSVGREWD